MWSIQMSVLTEQEIRLLQELEKGEQTISGNRDRQGLRRLVEAGYVIEQITNISDTIYTITALGRAALRAAIEN